MELHYVETPPQPSPEQPVTSDASKGNIDKFATKVSAEAILEKSNQRYIIYWYYLQ